MALLAQALAEHGVEYVLIGGTAMALHGFPRMTKDIDLFLPVDADNNRRLLAALQAIPNSSAAIASLRPEFMDQGYSTAFEGDIAIDLLYVAASKVFDDLRAHIKHVQFNGVVVSTLDIDGMLISKQTSRETDVPDRLKLERLRSALFEAEKQRRIANLPDLVLHKSPSVRLFARIAFASMNSADPSRVNWKEVEARVVDAAMTEPGMTHAEVANALCDLSPGAVFPSRQAAIRKAAALASRK
ncbi:nucleotidyl transferase AbiEii/AbiGii toxin family protein [Caenimonas sp. SL110]|uniref:nucleotidyl transferase AbiEii/AbiGii toxin family protein n=1 Tax=Caenimonas sp. SL110 TaxID=1450524 RepID=UPI001930EB28|nr:nucleotidyl transferase AbiEii/AbiGii toxin family protein [Caenimonas sp. SL110]